MKSTVDKFVQSALDHVGVSDEMRHLMLTPYREVKFELPIVCHDGGLRLLTGYRVQHDHGEDTSRRLATDGATRSGIEHLA